jgi:hypothetical protein
VRATCCEAVELPLEQTTLDEKNSPSSAHAGSIVRAQKASAIPSSDAHTSVAANDHDARFCGNDDDRSAADIADLWFELITGRNPGW